jgi:sugar O-acyltransferase (sialic acid O-acetyltransferase NeuD family)
MKNAIIVGAGTYGQVYVEYLKNTYNIIGYIDDDDSLTGKKIDNIKVLGDRKFLFNHMDKNTSIFVPIGNNEIRMDLLQKLTDMGFSAPSFIHPNSIIHDSVQIGKSVYILPGTNIMPCTVLKSYIMISVGVNISHHTIIEDGCFISHGSNIGASIHIQTKAYFGIASTIMTGVKNIGRNTLIGAGAVVIKDLPDNAVVAGVPAKILKYKEFECENPYECENMSTGGGGGKTQIYIEINF